MQKFLIRLFILFILSPLPTHAFAMAVQEEIAEIRAMIETETQRNTELKTLLAQKEKEMRDLKQNLKNIEDKIATLKLEHNIQ